MAMAQSTGASLQVPKQVCLLKRAIGAVHQRSLGSIGSNDETSQLPAAHLLVALQPTKKIG